MLFRKPKNPLEGQARMQKTAAGVVAEEANVVCPKCKKQLASSELIDTLSTCPYCRHHFRLNARKRLSILCDEGSFVEIDPDLTSTNVLGFPGYDKKLKDAMLQSAEKEAVVCGVGRVGSIETAVFVMEPGFMMGSMGTVVGEKITRLFELATQRNLPVVGFTVSGGARMQEGILSLMQMAKTDGAVKRHSDAGNLFLCVLTDPTTGGVTASFAMAADIILAEPFALIGFAGPRVIEQIIRKKLPDGFQRSEFLLERGFIDNIVDRQRQKHYISQLLALHEKGERV